MELGSFNGGKDIEHIGVGLVEISLTFAMLLGFSGGTVPFDSVYFLWHTLLLEVLY